MLFALIKGQLLHLGSEKEKTMAKMSKWKIKDDANHWSKNEITAFSFKMKYFWMNRKMYNYIYNYICCSSSPYGIIGGVLGGIVTIVVIFVIVLCRINKCKFAKDKDAEKQSFKQREEVASTLSSLPPPYSKSKWKAMCLRVLLTVNTFTEM